MSEPYGFPKPTRLARDVAKHQKRTTRAAEKKAEAARAAKLWSATSALVKLRDKGQCRVCRIFTEKSGDPRFIGQAHHIVYRSAGGGSTLENLAWLCGSCHDAEHTHRIDISGTSADLVVRR